MPIQLVQVDLLLIFLLMKIAHSVWNSGCAALLWRDAQTFVTINTEACFIIIYFVFILFQFRASKFM